MTDSELKTLVAQAQTRYLAMTPEQRTAHDRAQRRSYVLGEIGMGDDVEEAAYARAVCHGDIAEIDRLTKVASERVSKAKRVLDAIGL